VLSLRPEHKSRLLARGLDAEEIARGRYVSAPATLVERERAADALAPYLEAFGGGVPGFYRERGRWRMAYRPPGFFVPVRDERGFIQALSQRVDEPRDGGKYLWLSSDGRDGGASSGAPPHFAGRHLLHDAEEVTITEGNLKAAVASFLSCSPVIGVAGVHNTRGFAERLRESFLYLRRTVIAYDMDVIIKPAVRTALDEITTQLEVAGFEVRIRTWPDRWKGYDDYLLSQLGGGRFVA
jgi:hypothetical protein